MDKQHPKPCVDCRHFSRHISAAEMDECNSPNNFKPDVVYGAIQLDKPRALREDNFHSCGENGFWWEAKEK